MTRLRLFFEYLAANWKWALLVLAASAYFFNVSRAWWVRHEALAMGAVACAAKGHDAAWCDDAESKNGQECHTVILHTTGGYRSAPMPTLRSFDTDRYVACIELGVDGWGNARRAAQEAARAPMKNETHYP